MKKGKIQKLALVLGMVLIIGASIAVSVPAEVSAAETGHLTYTALGTDRTADYEIINPRDVFARDTPKIVCVWRLKGVKSGTVLKGAWIAEDVGNAAPPNYKIFEKAMTITTENEGAFYLTKPTNGWPVGKYRLEIYFNDDRVKTLPFTIKAERIAQETKPGSVPSNLLTSAVMTKRISTTHEALEPRTSFRSDEREIYCAFTVGNTPAGTTIKAVLIAVDIGAYAKPNSILITLSLVLDKGPMPGHFTFTNKKNWPPGKYRIELYLDDRLTKTLNFAIEA
jgi:outer membrane usher protein FimD/PapC